MTSESLDNCSDKILNSNMYRYSKNPFAHLATASWQPLSQMEMRKIFYGGQSYQSQCDADDYDNNSSDQLSRKKQKKRDYQKRKRHQRLSIEKPNKFDF
jgi:hypothetical protein